MDFLLPSEFKALADQEVYSNFDESEYEKMAAQLTLIQQAIFDKPVKHRYLKALYVKGFIENRPLTIVGKNIAFFSFLLLGIIIGLPSDISGALEMILGLECILLVRMN